MVGVAAGAKHVLVLAQSQSNSWARRFAPPDAGECEFVDCFLQSGDEGEAFACHKAVLAARSHYLGGFLLAAQRDQCQESGDSPRPVRLVLNCSSAVLKHLLEFLYKDTAPAQANPRQRLELVALAAELGLHSLAAQLHTCGAWISHRSPASTTQAATDQPPGGDCFSTFVRDMAGLLACSQHADMAFTAASRGQQRTVVGLAHRVVVSRIPYYAALLGGSFSDSHLLLEDADQPRRFEVSIDGLLLDGISMQSFQALLHFAYTGELVFGDFSDTKRLDEYHLDSVMNVLAAANRLGFQFLAQQCERMLSMHLGYVYESLLLR